LGWKEGKSKESRDVSSFKYGRPPGKAVSEGQDDNTLSEEKPQGPGGVKKGKRRRDLRVNVHQYRGGLASQWGVGY